MRQTRGRILAGLVIGLLVAGLFLAYDASRHTHSTYDVSITQYVQSWNTPGLSPFLNFISELTNFYPAVAIMTATFVLFFWRGLRVGFYSVVGSGDLFRNGSPFRLCGPAPSIPRPGRCIAIPDWKQLSQRPRLWSGVFYGFLNGVACHRLRWLPLRLLLPAITASIIVLAGVAGVYMGVRWASDVLGGLLLGVATLVGLLWVYYRLDARQVELLGLEFHVTQRRRPKSNGSDLSLWPGRASVHRPNPALPEVVTRVFGRLQSK